MTSNSPLPSPRRPLSLDEKTAKVAVKITDGNRVINISESNRISRQNQLRRSCIESNSIPLYSSFTKDNISYHLTTNFSHQNGRGDDPRYRMYLAQVKHTEAFELSEREKERMRLLSDIDALAEIRNVDVHFDDALPKISPRQTKIPSPPAAKKMSSAAGQKTSGSEYGSVPKVNTMPEIITPRGIDARNRIEEHLRAREVLMSELTAAESDNRNRPAPLSDTDLRSVSDATSSPHSHRNMPSPNNHKKESERRVSVAVPVIVGGSHKFTEAALELAKKKPKPPHTKKKGPQATLLGNMKAHREDLLDDTINSDGPYQDIPIYEEDDDSQSDDDTQTHNTMTPSISDVNVPIVKRSFHLKKMDAPASPTLLDATARTLDLPTTLNGERLLTRLTSGINIEIPTMPAPVRGPKGGSMLTLRDQIMRNVIVNVPTTSDTGSEGANWCLPKTNLVIPQQSTQAAVIGVLSTPRGAKDLFSNQPVQVSGGGPSVTPSSTKKNTSFHATSPSFFNLKRPVPSFAGFGVGRRNSLLMEETTNDFEGGGATVSSTFSPPLESALTFVIPPVVFKGLTSSGAGSAQVRRKRTMNVQIDPELQVKPRAALADGSLTARI